MAPASALSIHIHNQRAAVQRLAGALHQGAPHAGKLLSATTEFQLTGSELTIPMWVAHTVMLMVMLIARVSTIQGQGTLRTHAPGSLPGTQTGTVKTQNSSCCKSWVELPVEQLVYVWAAPGGRTELTHLGDEACPSPNSILTGSVTLDGLIPSPMHHNTLAVHSDGASLPRPLLRKVYAAPSCSAGQHSIILPYQRQPSSTHAAVMQPSAWCVC